MLHAPCYGISVRESGTRNCSTSSASPRQLLPEVRSSSEVYATTATDLLATAVPISGMAGDQQAALFGQMCTAPGMVKNTYGTGCFMLMHTGEQPVASRHNLLTTAAWRFAGRTQYALEGSVFMAGAVVQWLRDGLGILKSSAEVETLAASVADTGGVYLVPAFSGLGAPHWDPYARGSLFGLTRGSTAAHIARAALESIAYQSLDVLTAMEADAGLRLTQLRVDGGASMNNLLMQFQADILGVPLGSSENCRDNRAGGCLFGGLGGWLLERPRRDCEPVADRPCFLSPTCRQSVGRNSRPAGRRPWTAPRSGKHRTPNKENTSCKQAIFAASPSRCRTRALP